MKIRYVTALLLSAWHLPALAAGSCTSANLRFAGSKNTLYLQLGGVCRVADIASLRPQQLVDQGNGIYLLKASLKLTDGSVLMIDGDDATAPVTEFRLLSNNTGAANSVVNLTADHGHVQINHTKVLSWDEQTQGPDTEYATNRAFIRVRSSAADKESRMDISNSDIGYLGYYYAESYGLTWKVSGTLNDVRTYGSLLNSRVHHNYFGVFTYGAYGMTLDGNEIDHNVKYGLDPHDDSDRLTVTNNAVHHNGHHGIIFSKRCDHPVLRNNSSYSNTGHGIMLHRSVDNALVEGNLVFENSDTGIALFESNNSVVRDNLVQGNKYGIRLSMGSSGNRLEGNTISGTAQNSIYTYVGSDGPERPGNDGINRNNVWTRNNVAGSGIYMLKLSATDGDTFSNNDFTGNPGATFYLKGAINTTYTNNTVDPGMSLP